MRSAGTAIFVVTGLLLIGLGTTRDGWWTVLGGVGALAIAAWRFTETPEESTP